MFQVTPTFNDYVTADIYTSPYGQKYAGIGSTETPQRHLQVIKEIAEFLNGYDYTCVSGGAVGADTAFAEAAVSLEVWRPHQASIEAYEIAADFHPVWEHLSKDVKALHARNVHIILGADCDTPVQFVVAYTKNGQMLGGTAQGLRIAKAHRIPIYNLGDWGCDSVEAFKSWYGRARN